jgi:dTDP-glucose 4,6-dehydratase
MSGEKTLVIGSNAFSGQDFVDLLLDDPKREVIGVSRSRERSSEMLRYHDRAPEDRRRFRYQQIDLNHDLDALLALIDHERPQWVVNFAAQSEVGPSWQHPEHWFETNTVALAKLINALRTRDYVTRYLHVSSPEAYGSCSGSVAEDTPDNPSTPYAASKAAADMLLRTYYKQFGFPVQFVRATNVFGARQQLFKIIPRTAIYVRAGRRIRLDGGGIAVKSYIHVRDVSRGELAILEKGAVGELYHLSPPSGIAVCDVVRGVCEALGASFDAATEIGPERPGQDSHYIIDSSKARAGLGWAPSIPFNVGIAEVVDWVDRNWAFIQSEPLEYHHKP